MKIFAGISIDAVIQENDLVEINSTLIVSKAEALDFANWLIKELKDD
jgi:hypothetical protein